MKNIKNYLHLYLGCEGEIRHGELTTLTTQVLHQCHRPMLGMVFKPILRPLSDMTEEEAAEIVAASNTPTAEGKAIEGWQMKDYYSRPQMYDPEEMRILLSKHFDLFGLIDAGLAIDKTKL